MEPQENPAFLVILQGSGSLGEIARELRSRGISCALRRDYLPDGALNAASIYVQGSCTQRVIDAAVFAVSDFAAQEAADDKLDELNTSRDGIRRNGVLL